MRQAKRTTVFMEDEMHARLKRLAYAQRVPLAELIRTILANYINEQPPKAGTKGRWTR
jgi:hypothetical protein